MKRITIDLPDGVGMSLQAAMILYKPDGDKPSRFMFRGHPANYATMDLDIKPEGINSQKEDLAFGAKYRLEILAEKEEEGGKKKPEEAKEARKEKDPEKWAEDGSPRKDYWWPKLSDAKCARDFNRIKEDEGLDDDEWDDVLEACVEHAIDGLKDVFGRMMDKLR